METNKQNLILVPTDFSETCENAIEHAADLSEFLGYKVIILHVINKDTKTLFGKGADLKTEAGRRLGELCRKYGRGHRAEIMPLLKEGSIFDTITGTALETGANAIVLGTHGKVGVQHLTGAYALKIISRSAVPVFLVQKRHFGEGYREIVFPVSTYSEAEQKMAWAIYLSGKLKGKIHIFKATEHDHALQKQLDGIVAALTKMFDIHHLAYDVTIAAKGAGYARQVMDFAQEIRADLIMVMSKPSEFQPGYIQSPWDDRIFFNTEQIPVLVVNPVHNI